MCVSVCVCMCVSVCVCVCVRAFAHVSVSQLILPWYYVNKVFTVLVHINLSSKTYTSESCIGDITFQNCYCKTLATYALVIGFFMWGIPVCSCFSFPFQHLHFVYPVSYNILIHCMMFDFYFVCYIHHLQHVINIAMLNNFVTTGEIGVSSISLCHWCVWQIILWLIGCELLTS